MTIPMWMLLGFAAWTVLLLSATVGVYRWTRILSGRASVSSFRADQVEGEDWYRRGTLRSHDPIIWGICAFRKLLILSLAVRYG